ncbi:tetratricopeptide repeat protein [Novilysobacter erysipheiresistens]|uniref:Tetratricopeptide repeat protein n=1 Tax=Novilysobacter erysipheiresistens TaxID=1749332 RepID=A0ABU7YVV1_9GAMM
MTFDNPCQRFRCTGMAGGLALLLALAGCATLPEPAPPDHRDAMAVAREHLAAGQAREAVAALERAAAMEPASKEPWLEIARLRTTQGRHIDALAAAEQVLRRDPTDQVAYEITVDSGLQVALQTMKRLRAAGQAPAEGHEEQAAAIAALMAEVFEPELLISAETRTRLAREAVENYKANRVERLPEAQTKPKGDPLDLLGGD